MAMPLPTPVEPSRSRSSSTSKICRSCRPQSSAARLASSCSNCFLLPARSRATTAAGVISSSISMMTPAAPLCAAVPLGIDPADIAVVAAVDHVQTAMCAVDEHQRAAIGEVQATHRFAYRKRGDLGLHFGYHRRLTIGRFDRLVALFPARLLRGEDVVAGRARLERQLVMVAQPALVPA